MTDVLTEEKVAETTNNVATATEVAEATPKEPTLEELKAMIKALEEKENKSKDAISKACADAAEWKRKYRETLDSTEREKQEQADRFADMQTRLMAYEAKDRVNTYTQKLVAVGYPIEQASRMAEGLPDGIADSFFEEQKAFLEATKQRIKTEKLNAQPNLPVGTPPTPSGIADKENEDLRRWIGLK